MMINCYKDEYNLMMIMIKVVAIVVVFAPGVMVDGSVVMLVMHSDGSVVAIV